MRIGIFILLLAMLSSCSALNIFKGPDDYYKNYYAEELKDSIDRAIESEKMEKSPNGYLTKTYSRELWDQYWNDRIFHIFSLGGQQTPDSYVGPSGKEFVQYIINERAKAGLPPINIEGRNLAKVPKA